MTFLRAAPFEKRELFKSFNSMQLLNLKIKLRRDRRRHRRVRRRRRSIQRRLIRMKKKICTDQPRLVSPSLFENLFVLFGQILLEVERASSSFECRGQTSPPIKSFLKPDSSPKFFLIKTTNSKLEPTLSFSEI